MRQSGVFGFAYRNVVDSLSGLGASSGLYRMGERAEPDDVAAVSVAVTDLCQLCADKNGQRIIVDESLYELPAIYAMVVAISVKSADWSRALDAAGAIVAFFKDNVAFEAAEYNWHGNDAGRLFIEPVVRKTAFGQPSMSGPDDGVKLEYRIEAGINSQKGEKFTRVDKRDLRGDLMK